MNQSQLLEALNPQQREAVVHTEGPLLVLAGAGSGKTRVLTYRIAFLIERRLAAPHEILAVTFTNKAANEMKTRVESLLNMSVQHLWIGTFHSICARFLRQIAKYIGYQSNFTIYDVDDQIAQIKRIMDFLNISREIISPKVVQYTISQAKNQMKDARQFEKQAYDYRSQQIAKIFWEYEAALRKNNAFDFDDLLIKPIDVFTAHPEVLEAYQRKFKYLLVDEYQDTNKAQYYLIKLLAANHQNVCVVGDEDQSIYRWRGANIENILNFEKDYPETRVIRLEQNYRSTQTILSAANSVVANNVNRLGKNLWSKQGKGEKIKVVETRDESSEASAVVQFIQQLLIQKRLSYNDMVILYRTNAQSRALEEQLRAHNIPYTIVGGMKFYERKEIKDILAYLKVLVNPTDWVSLRRIINFPSRGIGEVTINKLEKFSRQRQWSLFQTLERVREISDLPPNTAKKVEQFYQQLKKIRDQLSRLNALEITQRVVEEFRLKKIYEDSRRPEDESRVENINELLNSIQIFLERNPDSGELEHYLAEVTLMTDIDNWDPSNPTVTLMTLHSAKGLEFPVVFITGLEDGLFPLSRSFEQEDDLEEERRLFYVGLTRAKEQLYLLYALNRRRFGQENFGSFFQSMPSRFLSEIPSRYVERIRWGKQNNRYRRKKESYFRAEKPLTAPLDTLPDEEGKFKIGQWVRHESFGKGQILGVEKSRLGTKLTIYFERKEIKKLVAEYANLEITEETES